MIRLAWPPKELNPNARVHFHQKARAAKAYRDSAYWLAKSSPVDSGNNEYNEDETQITLQIQFLPPDKRKRDLDNMLSSIKSGLDGIADALCINDQRFALNISRGAPVKGGKVMVAIA